MDTADIRQHHSVVFNSFIISSGLREDEMTTHVTVLRKFENCGFVGSTRTLPLTGRDNFVFPFSYPRWRHSSNTSQTPIDTSEPSKAYAIKERLEI
jgi:hypothetical protein